VQYETGETIYTADNPRAVSPGSEYPLTGLGTGTASIAKTVKWGQDTEVTDEAIARQNMQPVEKALTKLANQNVKFVDSVALSAISSAVTNTAPLRRRGRPRPPADPDRHRPGEGEHRGAEPGLHPDTVVVSDLSWAYAFAKFTSGGFLPRETGRQLGCLRLSSR
jgi:hypothetical protein